MSDQHSTQLAAAPGYRPEPRPLSSTGTSSSTGTLSPAPQPGPLPCCPVCEEAPERISWRQRPGQPVVLVFDPCGHRHGSPAAPVLAVSPLPVTGWGRALA
ncbi:hypothetical protein OHA37_02485 [Streptomyces sp. NBC_00335]|uniref:hypothetical protein n=1 Tax=unclassified Streptomyces TaxID=2593676 RepID=UPI0022594EA2|nr:MULTISPECIES: hypothetical protein [unclassified Streptomyces]MCX5402751.1 hypothetical protein [Streptomyces sp. NBC_00086]